jgi:hypothetical protein
LRVRVASILLVVTAVGAVAGYVALDRMRAVPPPAAPTPLVSPTSPFASARPEAVPTRAAAGIAPTATRGEASHRDRSPADSLDAKTRRLAAREPYTRADLRRLLERVFADKLGDRQLGSEDYERLVDATLRLRAALRVLRGTDESSSTAAVREEQRQTVRTIFEEIEAITGLPPAELGSVLTSEDTAGDAPSP